MKDLLGKRGAASAKQSESHCNGVLGWGWLHMSRVPLPGGGKLQLLVAGASTAWLQQGVSLAAA